MKALEDTVQGKDKLQPILPTKIGLKSLYHLGHEVFHLRRLGAGGVLQGVERQLSRIEYLTGKIITDRKYKNGSAAWNQPSISENIEGNKLNLNLTFYIGHCKEYQASFTVLKT